MNEILLRSPEVNEAYDATLPEFNAYAEEVATWFAAQDMIYAEVDEAARDHAGGDRAFGFRIALKLAESRRLISGLDQPVTITLINPVYKETGRIQRRAEHPHGEDSIRCKAEILKGLEKLSDHLTCRLLVVDDECPDGSGKMAAEIFESDYPDELSSGKFDVLYLREAIDAGHPDVPPGLTHKDGPNRSVKGGALLYGMRTAVNHEVDGLHILVDNDADLSIHPAQLGLLIEPIVNGEAEAVAGSRREIDSVALIGGSRDTRGQLFIKIWQHLLPELAGTVVDTNRAFKAFTAGALAKILGRIGIYTFPYQIELLQACVSGGIGLRTRGIAYVDSEAASTQQGEAITETYLNQVHQIIDIATRYQTIDMADPLVGFLSNISEERWLSIETDPPDRLGDLLP
ncbi:MAG: hypothetical protein ACR2RV_00790 [Verrucomicrobiales bacterium]